MGELEKSEVVSIEAEKIKNKKAWCSSGADQLCCFFYYYCLKPSLSTVQILQRCLISPWFFTTHIMKTLSSNLHTLAKLNVHTRAD
jgi:hypothetical protein